MTSRFRRLVAFLVPLATGSAVAGAQTVPRVEAGASAGGSAFGWQPHIGVGGELLVPPLGAVRASLHGTMAKFDATNAARSEMTRGAKLSTPPGDQGWWLSADVVRRTGLKDLAERPRISSGGWRRIGPVIVGVAASRRSADLATVRYVDRELTTHFSYLDSITGEWDTTSTTTTVTDTARTSGSRRWAETEGTLFWESNRITAQLALGGRFAGRDVPASLWAGGELAVRLTTPLSLVIGGGTVTSSRFLLDSEHRYLTLGFRIRPPASSSAEDARAGLARTSALAGFDVAAVARGRYRLSLWAPRASRVELSGDFTGWKPLPLERGPDGRWSVSLVLLPGAHRVNARVDGGPWIVPPGLTTLSDDFAGEVGILVIEGEHPSPPK